MKWKEKVVLDFTRFLLRKRERKRKETKNGRSRYKGDMERGKGEGRGRTGRGLRGVGGEEVDLPAEDVTHKGLRL